MLPKKRPWESDETIKELRIRTKFLHDPTIEVIVGADEDVTTWNISKALLSQSSEFFRAACNGPFKEGLENKVVLPDQNPAAFEEWDDDLGIPYVSLTLICWVLADSLIVADFKARIMWEIFEGYVTGTGWVSADEILYIWANTASASKLRDFMLDHLISYWTDRYNNELYHDETGWLNVFAQVPDISNKLLFELAKAPNRRRKIKDLEAYLDDEKDGDTKTKS